MIRRLIPRDSLDLVFAMAVACALLTVIEFAVDIASYPWWMIATYTGTLITLVAAWTRLRRRRHHDPRAPRLLPPVVGTGAVVLLLIGGGPPTLPMLLVAVLVGFAQYGRRAVVLLSVSILVTVVAVLTGLGKGFQTALVQAATLVPILAFTAALGQLLRDRDVANASLAAAHEKLQRSVEMEKELLLAQERARAARDLHDGLGHRLTLMGMSLDYAVRMRSRDADSAWREVDVAREYSGTALQEMRTWVRALNPVRSPDLTGVAAVEAIASSFRGTGFRIDVVAGDGASSISLTEDQELYLHRFVQEGLTNALRHGRASSVTIRLDRRPDGGLTLRLSDDGCALAGQVCVREGFGLRSLRERVCLLGGQFHTEIGPGGGLEIAAVLPVVATQSLGVEHEPQPTQARR